MTFTDLEGQVWQKQTIVLYGRPCRKGSSEQLGLGRRQGKCVAQCFGLGMSLRKESCFQVALDFPDMSDALSVSKDAFSVK